MRRERIEHRVVNGVAESNDTTVTINDPSAHTFARWVEGVVGETSITVIDFHPSCAPRLPEELTKPLSAQALVPLSRTTKHGWPRMRRRPSCRTGQ